MKKIIFNADDFGKDKAFNEAIKDGFLNGCLNSTTIMANGNAFEDAILNCFPLMKGIDLGVHLNIIEGNWLIDKTPFKYDFIGLLLKSFDKKFLERVEQEFRLQIETVLKYTKPTHLDSHVHVHAIPAYFEIVCRLAKEYDMGYVRTQFEKPYFIPDIKKYLGKKYFVNLLKVVILNFFTLLNKRKIKQYNLTTNDYIIGVNYTGYMDENTIKYGISVIKNKNKIVEILLHPSTDKNNNPLNYLEYLTIKNY